MADAYKVLQDTSFPRPLRTAVTLEGVELQETTGQAYAAGDYLFHDELSFRDQQRVEDGELDDFLEAVSAEEAATARQALDTGLFIPEHEAERYALLEAGHRVIEKDQVLELRAAGNEAYAAALAESKKGPNDANPGITEQESFVEMPSLAEVSRGEADNVPLDHDHYVSPAELEVAESSSDSGVEFPPGLPVGPVLAKAEGADPEEVDKEASKPRTARRAKPTSSTPAKKDSDS